MADEVFVQAILKHDDNLPRDSVVNTFAFAGVDTDVKQEMIFDEIVRFYNVAVGGPAFSIASRMSSALNGGINQCELRMYDIAGKLGLDVTRADEDHPLGRPFIIGSPVATRLWTLGPLAVDVPLPSEAALCITTEGIDWDEFPVEGAGGVRPRSRRRGRLFLGPWGTGANENNAGVSRPLGDLRDVCLASAARLQASVGLTGPAWGVWSRANAVVTPIESISSANDWDTIRSRGERATGRSRVVI